MGQLWVGGYREIVQQLAGGPRRFQEAQLRLRITTIELWSRYVECGGGLELGTLDQYLTGEIPLDGADIDLLDLALSSLSTPPPRPATPG